MGQAKAQAKSKAPRVDLETILDNLTAYDFAFCAVDEEGTLCSYDALFACEDPSSGETYLIYADAEATAHDDVATYASVLISPDDAEDAQFVVDSEIVPEELPVLELAEITSEEGNAFVERVLTALELVE